MREAPDALRVAYLTGLEDEIGNARWRLSEALRRMSDHETPRLQALVAIASVTLDSLEAERDRAQDGGRLSEPEAMKVADYLTGT